LWNQQGSTVIRGHLLVIPIGHSLLYVEPIYLQANTSPMPELRLVVVATQEKLGYGLSFTEAMTSLLGQSMTSSTSVSEEKQKAEQKPNETAAPQQSATPATTQNLQQLVERAIQEFDDYQRLTSQGKLGEAGQKLEQHKHTLEEIKKLSGKQ